MESAISNTPATTELESKSDEILIEEYAAKLARISEVPFFATPKGRRFAKRIWDSTYRINFFDPKNERIRSILVTIENGSIQER